MLLVTFKEATTRYELNLEYDPMTSNIHRNDRRLIDNFINLIKECPEMPIKYAFNEVIINAISVF